MAIPYGLTAGGADLRLSDCLPLLLDLASSGPFVLTTGRGKGDEGQRSFKGHEGDKYSRVDHCLLSGGLYGKLVSVSLDDACAVSDHIPIILTFPFNSAAQLPTTAPPPIGTQLRWVPGNEHLYGASLMNDVEGRNRLHAALEEGDVDRAGEALMGLIERAATAAGMVAPMRQGTPRRPQAGKRRPEWFDAQCLEAKRCLRRAVKCGHAREQYVKEYRATTRRSKRRYDHMRAAR